MPIGTNGSRRPNQSTRIVSRKGVTSQRKNWRRQARQSPNQTKGIRHIEHKGYKAAGRDESRCWEEESERLNRKERKRTQSGCRAERLAAASKDKNSPSRTEGHKVGQHQRARASILLSRLSFPPSVRQRFWCLGLDLIQTFDFSMILRFGG